MSAASIDGLTRSIRRLRRATATLNLACALAIVAVWIEQAMGLVVPGFIPTPLGEVCEHMPTLREITVPVGIWRFGAIEPGRMRDQPLPDPATAGPTAAAGAWQAPG